MAFNKIITHLSPEYARACDLRNTELRFPLGLSLTKMDIEEDRKAIHLGIFEDHSIIACACLWPQHHENRSFQIRQVAVKQEHKKSGFGRRIMGFAENVALQNGAKEVFVHARMPVVQFYEKLGYTIVGEIFYEVGIQHIQMIHRLQ